MDVARFKKKPLLGIVRGVAAGAVAPLVETAVAAGLETLEITMNTPGAEGCIREAVKAAHGRMTIGAGTVLTAAELRAALDAGATFIVMPALIDDVVAECVRSRVPVFPGALTPQEVYRAWQAGAAMVKVFPAGCFGPKYFREIKGPFAEVPLLACGGVTPENIAEYFKNGACAAAFGGSVFKKEWLEEKDFSKIGEAVRRFVSAADAAASATRGAYEKTV